MKVSNFRKAIEKITESIEASGGNCKVSMPPKAVSANEDAELERMLQRREAEDKDSSDEEDDA